MRKENGAMIFVYPYKRKPHDFLIGHSIRLVENHYPDAKIVIIGDNYKDYEHIPCKDPYLNRGANVTNKLLKAANIYNKFVFMNDDFLINDKFQFDKHHKHTAKLMRRDGQASAEWNTAVDNCIHWLRYHDYPTDSYECHQPVIIDSKKLIDLMECIDWKHEAHFIKSLYCNVYQKETITIDNTKLIRPDIGKANMLLEFVGCISIGDGFMNDKGINFIKTLV